MRKIAIRIEKSAVTSATIIERLRYSKVPTMACIAECNDQHHRPALQSGIVNAPGPLVSGVEHVALESFLWPMIGKRYH